MMGVVPVFASTTGVFVADISKAITASARDTEDITDRKTYVNVSWSSPIASTGSYFTKTTSTSGYTPNSKCIKYTNENGVVKSISPFSSGSIKVKVGTTLNFYLGCDKMGANIACSPDGSGYNLNSTYSANVYGVRDKYGQLCSLSIPVLDDIIINPPHTEYNDGHCHWLMKYDIQK